MKAKILKKNVFKKFRDVLKGQVLLPFAGFLFWSPSAVSGVIHGGGGDGIICGSDVYLADTFYLFKDSPFNLREFYSAADASVLTPLLSDYFRKIPETVPSTDSAYRIRFVFTKQVLKELEDDDIDVNLLPQGCRKQQLAIQDRQTLVVTVQEDLYAKLSEFEKALLRFHEGFVSGLGEGQSTAPIRKVLERWVDPAEFYYSVGSRVTRHMGTSHLAQKVLAIALQSPRAPGRFRGMQIDQILSAFHGYNSINDMWTPQGLAFDLDAYLEMIYWTRPKSPLFPRDQVLANAKSGILAYLRFPMGQGRGTIRTFAKSIMRDHGRLLGIDGDDPLELGGSNGPPYKFRCRFHEDYWSSVIFFHKLQNDFQYCLWEQANRAGEKWYFEYAWHDRVDPYEDSPKGAFPTFNFFAEAFHEPAAFELVDSIVNSSGFTPAIAKRVLLQEVRPACGANAGLFGAYTFQVVTRLYLKGAFSDWPLNKPLPKVEEICLK